MKSQKITITTLQENSFHVFITVKINDVKCRLLVDTGASVSVIDKSFFEKKFNKKTKVIEVETSSLHNTQMQSHLAKIKTMTLAGATLKNLEFAALDLSHVNDNYKKINVKKIQGILGSDILYKQKMIIDYAKAILYFL